MEIKTFDYKKALESIAKNSNDPKTKVGCLAVIDGFHLWGYNHFPKDLPQEEVDNRTERFYKSVTHSEIDMCNYANKMGVSLKGTTVYVSLFPCDNCARRLIDEGVVKVIAYADRPQADYIIRAKELFIANNVEFEIIKEGDK